MFDEKLTITDFRQEITTNPQNSIAVSHDGIKGVEPGLNLLVRELAHLFTNSVGGHRCYRRLEKLTMLQENKEQCFSFIFRGEGVL